MVFATIWNAFFCLPCSCCVLSCGVAFRVVFQGDRREAQEGRGGEGDQGRGGQENCEGEVKRREWTVNAEEAVPVPVPSFALLYRRMGRIAGWVFGEFGGGQSRPWSGRAIHAEACAPSPERQLRVRFFKGSSLLGPSCSVCACSLFLSTDHKLKFPLPRKHLLVGRKLGSPRGIGCGSGGR